MGFDKIYRRQVMFRGGQSSSGAIVRQKWTAPAAASATYVNAGITTAVVTTSGLTQPDFPRVLSVTGGGATHGATGNVVINGTDIRGATISDTITLNSNTTVNGAKAFSTVTSVDTTGVSSIGAASTVQVGISAALGLSAVMDADEYITGSAATNSSSNGVYEATRATIAVDPVNVSGNTVTFNTAPNGTKVFRAVFVSKEISTNRPTTS